MGRNRRKEDCYYLFYFPSFCRLLCFSSCIFANAQRLFKVIIHNVLYIDRAATFYLTCVNGTYKKVIVLSSSKDFFFFHLLFETPWFNVFFTDFHG